MINNDLFNSTLVPIDFSENSLLALDHAAAISKAMTDRREQITLLHIIEGGNFNSVTDASQVESGSRDSLAIEGAINRLKKIAEKFSQDKNLSFTFMVAGGKAYRKIAEIAEQIKSSLIVMGTHGSSGIQAFAGSNASKVIQIAHCPVVVIKEKAFNSSRGYKNIVLPLDLTRESKQKVSVTAKIAEYFKSTVHILTMEEGDEFLANRLQNNMAQVQSYFDERNIPSTATTLESGSGNFAKQTIVWAQGKDADLIVIMAQQEKEGFSEFVFGSYAQQIVNRSPIPVMAVTPREELEGLYGSTIGSGIYSH